MIFTRSKKVQKEYKEKIKMISKDECFICDKELLVEEFEFWVLLKNRYPYNESKNHYLLCPKRHVNDRRKLSIVEYTEFKYLREIGLEKKGYNYDVAQWNTKEESSFKYHAHCQIIELKLYYKIKKWIKNY